jgi:uncharacterized protein YkwD
LFFFDNFRKNKEFFFAFLLTFLGTLFFGLRCILSFLERQADISCKNYAVNLKLANIGQGAFMINIRGFFLIAGAFSMIISCTNISDLAEDFGRDPYIGHSDVEVVNDFVEIFNNHRASLGLNKLKWHDGVADVAYKHSLDMETRNYFSHYSPEGDGPGDRLDKAGISYSGWGENIAAGYPSGDDVFNGWFNSPGHKANMENPNWTHHGVGLAEGGGTYYRYWTHVFAINPKP